MPKRPREMEREILDDGRRNDDAVYIPGMFF